MYSFNEYAGIFAREDNDKIVTTLSAAADRAGESVWRLPLDETHFKQIESKFGDIINSGAGSPGASVGAAFIGSFVGNSFTLLVFALVAGSLIASGIGLSLVLPYRSAETKKQGYQVTGQVT